MTREECRSLIKIYEKILIGENFTGTLYPITALIYIPTYTNDIAGILEKFTISGNNETAIGSYKGNDYNVLLVHYDRNSGIMLQEELSKYLKKNSIINQSRVI